MNNNPFLRDFLKMRQAISVPAQPHPKAPKKNKEPEPLKKLGAPEMSIAKIIEEKPKKLKLMDWMQERANQLTTEKMK